MVPGRPLGEEGGEGRVYEPQGVRWRGKALKLYTKSRPDARKLRAMINRPPRDPARPRHVSIAWPTHVVVDGEGAPAGLLMPQVPGPTHSMDQLYNPLTRQELWDDFRPTYGHLLLVARAVAGGVYAIHAAGHCVGDLNPKNLLLSRRTKYVTLIDCDSMQIVDGRDVFRCPVGVPEYTAPELQDVARFGEVNRTKATDAFGLAVLIFQLTMEGLHPFSVSWPNPYQDAPPVKARIRQGIFPYAPQSGLSPPPGALPFEVMNPGLRDLVMMCFAEGHGSPMRRPAPQAWIDAIDIAHRELVTCGTNRYHRYGGHLAACPWCQRKSRTGVDPFPTPFVVRAIEGTEAPRVRPRPPREPARPQPAAHTVPLAGPRPASGLGGSALRAVATLLDLVTATVLAEVLPLGGVLAGLTPELRSLLLGLGVVVAYGSLAEWLGGRTLGKLAVGLRVVGYADSSRLGLRASLRRNLWKYVGLVGCWLLLVGAIRSGDGRTVGDRRTNALVVRRPPPWQAE